MSNLENIYWKSNIFPYSWLPHGETVQWSGTDTLENFKKNPDKTYSLEDVTYTYNPQGFRTKDLNEYVGKKVNLALGCSFTEGVGLPEHEVWPSLIEQETEFPMLNLGLGGGATDTVARILSNVADMFDIQTVYILWPPFTRFEYYECEQGLLVMSANEATTKHVWNLDEYNSIQRYYKNKFIVDTLAKLHGFTVVAQAWDQIDLIFKEHPHILARDGGHPGAPSQKIIANRFLSHSKETVYINGEASSLAYHLGGLSASYGTNIAYRLNAVLICEAAQGKTNEEIAESTLKYIKTVKPRCVIIGWNTWEAEAWMCNGQRYIIAGGCAPTDYPKALRSRFTEWKNSLYSDESIRRTEEKSHSIIWDLHCTLKDAGIKHLFFNTLSHLSTIKNKKDWGGCYIEPYDANYTIHKWCADNVKEKSITYALSLEDHAAWAEFLLPKLNGL
jgi:hypothetical protein